MEIKQISNKIPSFLKKIGLYFVGTFSTRLLSVLLVPIYAYFVSSVDLGEYDYIYAIVNILYPIAFLCIWESILKYGMQRQEDFESMASNCAIVYFVSSIILTTACAICMMLNYTNIVYVFILSISLGGATLWQFMARCMNQTKFFVISGVVSSLMIIFVDLFLASIQRLDYKGLCISSVFSQITVIILLESKVHLFRTVKFKLYNTKLLMKMLSFSIPLVVNNIALYLYNSSSKIIIREFLGAYENGQYSFASKFAILINVFSSVVSMAVIEEAYSYSRLEEYRNKVGTIIEKISQFYYNLIFLALPAIYLLYSVAFQYTEYYFSCDYIFILLLGALFTSLSSNYGSAFQVTEKTKYIFITTVSGSVASIIVSLFAIKYIGVYGVLAGGTLGPFLMMCLRAIYAKKATGLIISWKKNLISFILCILEYFMLAKYKSIFIQVVILIFSLLYILFIYRKQIKLVCNIIITRGGVDKMNS